MWNPTTVEIYTVLLCRRFGIWKADGKIDIRFSWSQFKDLQLQKPKTPAH
jgi:hypothetical protein